MGISVRLTYRSHLSLDDLCHALQVMSDLGKECGSLHGGRFLSHFMISQILDVILELANVGGCIVEFW